MRDGKKELIAYFDERFRETSQQIQALREETVSRFAEVDRQFGEAEETARLTLVLVESLIKMVARYRAQPVPPPR